MITGHATAPAPLPPVSSTPVKLLPLIPPTQLVKSPTVSVTPALFPAFVADFLKFLNLFTLVSPSLFAP